MNAKIIFRLTNIALLMALTMPFPSNADELKFYFITPPVPLQWKSPSSLVRSLQSAQQSDSNSPIGHVAVEVTCETTEHGPAKHFFDGMTMKDERELLVAVNAGRGLGIMIDNYQGQLHGESYRSAIDHYSCSEDAQLPNAQSRLNFLRMKINAATCQRVAKYYEDYKRRAIEKIYGGFNTHPFRGTPNGAGCSVFGMSVLEVAGLYSSEFEAAWTRKVRIPQRLIGSETSPISAIKIVLTGHAWASEFKPGVTLQIPDPALMHEWVKQKIRSKESGYTPEKQCQYSSGVAIDLSMVPTPTIPIWQN